MFEKDYNYFQSNLRKLNRFHLNGITYAPFVSLDGPRPSYDGKPNMFWHLTTSSKERDCTDESPIVPCCNTIQMASCEQIEKAKEAQEILHRIPCPYRAAGIKLIKKTIDSLSFGNFQGISAAIFKDLKGRKKMVLRRRCGCLDYVCIFKCYPTRYEPNETVIPLRLLTGYPLAYRSMISKFNKIIEEQGILMA